MRNKPVLVYLNHDTYSQVDDTVLKHLTSSFEVHWFYLYESWKTMRLTVEDVNYYSKINNIIPHLFDCRYRMRDIRNFLYYKQITHDINLINPDIIYHCHRNPYWTLVSAISLKCKNVVLGVHDAQKHSYSFSISKFLETATKSISLWPVKNYITFSSNQHDLFFRKYKKESMMVGMSYKSFGVSEISVQKIDKGVKLLFFGIISKYKGLDQLIDCLEDLYKEGINNLSITIAGRGEFWTECKKHIQTNKLYDLKIRFIENCEIPDLMSSHHFLILPYRDATQSGPLVTAIAYCLPVIAPNYGCFKETYNKNNALLYDPGELKNVLKKASEITQEQYGLMKKQCEIIKELYSEESIAFNYINYFNSLIN